MAKYFNIHVDIVFFELFGGLSDLFNIDFPRKDNSFDVVFMSPFDGGVIVYSHLC